MKKDNGCSIWFVVQIVSSQSKNLTAELDWAGPGRGGPKSLCSARAGPKVSSKKSARPRETEDVTALTGRTEGSGVNAAS